jgi:precorrin-2 dehydrogenase / sirohydrochlorin ferrochelatase
LIPIHLDPATMRIGLVGNGPLALRRYLWLKGLDCAPQIWSPDPTPEFLAAVRDQELHCNLPDAKQVAALSVLWIADLDEAVAQEIAALARSHKTIVNVEDVLPLCDFHTPAIVRRGQLLVSIGTKGSSPAAASFVRRLLELALPMAWGDVLASLATSRQKMRTEGASPREIIAASKAQLRQDDTAAMIAPCGGTNCTLLAKVHEAI